MFVFMRSIVEDYTKGDDYVYDIEVTTNRVDIMSVVGIARECFGHIAKVWI